MQDHAFVPSKYALATGTLTALPEDVKATVEGYNRDDWLGMIPPARPRPAR